MPIDHAPPPTRPRRRRRAAMAATLAGALTLGSLGLPSPAGAVPEAYVSDVEGHLALKGSPNPFSGVTIQGTYDADTGELTAQATFPRTVLVQEDVLPGNDAEVALQISQPSAGVGSIDGEDVTLDAAFQIVVESVTLIEQASGNRTPLPLGPTPDSCRFGPIEVDLVGTATTIDDAGTLEVTVADDEFVIPPPADEVTDCGPIGGLLIPEVAGPAEGEDPNSAELTFTLGSPEVVVQKIYQHVLGRSAEPAAVEHWVGRLQAGVSPFEVATTIARTTEGWRNAVRDSYLIAFDRNADAGGLGYWTDALRGSQNQPYLVSYLFSSPEGLDRAKAAFPGAATDAEAYIRHLYRRLLDRPAGAGEIAFWSDRIDAAPTAAIGRNQAARFVYTSAEAATMAVLNAEVLVCENGFEDTDLVALEAAFIASGFRTRVLLAVASVTPCPAFK